MKATKLLTLIVLTLTVSQLKSQDSFNNDQVASSDDRSFRLGLHFSPNLSWLKPNTSGYESAGTSMGFSYGLSTEFFITKNYLFSTGISLNALAGKLKYEGVYSEPSQNHSSEIEEKVKLRYIDIPLILKLRTNEIGYITYYGNFGLNAGFKYKATSDITYKDYNKSENGVDSSSDFNLINLNLVVGAGIEYSLSGNTNILLGVNYNNGFVNVIDRKNYVLDNSGQVTFDNEGNAIEGDKKVSSTLGYFTLNVGVYF